VIEGVRVKPLVKFADDRGYFMEIVRDDEDLLSRFGQVSCSLTYPGVVKAFHYHERQDDLWFFPVGNAQVVLHDLRAASPTYRHTDVVYMGEHNPIALLIPAGVAHGYRVLGERPALLVYVTTAAYNREQPDEHRLPWNDPAIGFDWTTRFR
jgi:dTDP-4-dehydrorhamnose 3,5-epimerase and related enzymes